MSILSLRLYPLLEEYILLHSIHLNDLGVSMIAPYVHPVTAHPEVR
jgi:hypothetical protein